MIEGIKSGGSAMLPVKVFLREQNPEPLESRVGSTKVFSMRNKIAGQSAVVQRDVLILKQYPEPLEPGVGQTEVFAMDSVIEKNPPMPFRSPLVLRQYPDPLESNIGKQDLPGGFRWYSVISGQKSPFQDLARGVVQIDDVKVLFDMKG